MDCVLTLVIFLQLKENLWQKALVSGFNRAIIISLCMRVYLIVWRKGRMKLISEVNLSIKYPILYHTVKNLTIQHHPD